MNVDFEGPNSNAVAPAVSWLEATMLGSIATAVTGIAVGNFGVLLFLGRVLVRRAIDAVFGAFILFGASSTASGIMRSLNGSAKDPEMVASLAPPPPIEPTAQGSQRGATIRTPSRPFPARH